MYCVCGWRQPSGNGFERVPSDHEAAQLVSENKAPDSGTSSITSASPISSRIAPEGRGTRGAAPTRPGFVSGDFLRAASSPRENGSARFPA
jgi:hypothetical protein